MGSRGGGGIVAGGPGFLVGQAFFRGDRRPISHGLGGQAHGAAPQHAQGRTLNPPWRSQQDPGNQSQGAKPQKEGIGKIRPVAFGQGLAKAGAG